jgi:hypothetical protein
MSRCWLAGRERGGMSVPYPQVRLPFNMYSLPKYTFSSKLIAVSQVTNTNTVQSTALTFFECVAYSSPPMQLKKVERNTP